jgi:D-beta-D-heptose 7-phosphate kinase/D-beta-D-heptose 1-phosphate adenosyltransferase
MQLKLDKKRSDALINSFKQKTILVLGDLMLDEYLFGQVSRISPEAPVPVVEVSEEKYLLGGAANVAWNIASLGARVVPVGVIGRDRPRQTILKEFQKRKISKNGLVEDPRRHTTIKTRIVAHHQQVVRVDREHRQDLSPASEARVIARLKKLVPAADAVLIEDYNKGLITDRVLKAVLELCRRHKKTVTVDPKFNHFLDFKGVTLFKPNVLETERALGMKISGPEDMLKAGRMLMTRLKARAVLITAGDRGMYLITSENNSQHIPTMAREVYDVSGAGDTVIAVLTLALAAGASFLEAAVLANHAAGVEVSKFGVAAVSVNELKEALKNW